MEVKQLLLNNLDKIHTTDLGITRIKKNLHLTEKDVIAYCKNKIQDINSVVNKKGKNYYVKIDNVIITINSYSYTIITARLQK